MNDGYILEIPAFGITLELDRLRREHEELHGELTVRIEKNLEIVRTIAGNVIHQADFNLSSTRARNERAKLLHARAPIKNIDWPGAIEDLCYQTFAKERAGNDVIDLRTLPKPEADTSLTLYNLEFPKKSPTILFGDGGSGKSYLALYFAGYLQSKGLRVGYFDWECEPNDHRRRLERLFGSEMPQVFYCECQRSLHDEVDRLSKIVRESKLDYAIYDSVAFACEGPPEAAESASRYFRATRRIGIGSLHIAHINKSDNHDQKPFGSTFWHNGARSTWFVKAVNDDRQNGSLEIGLYNRKSNLGPLCNPVGLQFQFESYRTRIIPATLADKPELAAKLRTKDRIIAVLSSSAGMTYAELSAELDIPYFTVQKSVKRNIEEFTEIDGKIRLK